MTEQDDLGFPDHPRIMILGVILGWASAAMQRAGITPDMTLKALEIAHLRGGYDDHDLYWYSLHLGEDTRFVFRLIKFALEGFEELAPRNAKGLVDSRKTVDFAFGLIHAGDITS